MYVFIMKNRPNYLSCPMSKLFCVCVQFFSTRWWSSSGQPTEISVELLAYSFYFKFIYLFIFILFAIFKLFQLFSYRCLHFLPTPLLHLKQTHLPPLLPPSPLVLSMCPLQLFLKTLLPTIPSPLPSGYCQIVLNFSVSGYILFAFFFC